MSSKLGFAGINPRNHTLLIVDDEEDLREILVYQFQKDGFNVLEAGNGAEAFEIIKSRKVDVVISDIKMPGGNGVELLDNVRRYNPDVPVVLFITGFAEITVEDAFNKGVEAVFAKPFDRKVLLNTVLQALVPKTECWQPRTWCGETPLDIDVISSELQVVCKAKVINLSQGGLFISVEDRIPTVGEKINFKIHFDEGVVLCIEGEGVVRWVRTNQGEFPRGCGVEFVGLAGRAKTHMLELINFLKTRQYIC